ncbi:MAG: hypothetical protein E6J41_11200 [Chloroflexi bacterium]|nr:MAG: hypothetical protein E6J41_11200 [Chloroflexota bacterium]
MDRQTTMSDARPTRRHATAPKPVRRIARAARLSLEKLAEALVDGQPSPERPRDQAALLHWLRQTVRNAHPGAALDELTTIMADRLQKMADSGDVTAKAMLEAEVREHFLNLTRIALALAGGLTAPDPPAVPEQARQDAIASTVIRLTGWASVPNATVEAIYRWLFADESAFLASAEMRVEAVQRILENPTLREVSLPHPDTGDTVLVTCEEILEHAEADLRVMEAAQRYDEKQLRWHRRLVGALGPYGDDAPSVGEAVRRAAVDLGVEQGGRSFEEFADLVVAAAEARGTAAAGRGT